MLRATRLVQIRACDWLDSLLTIRHPVPCRSGVLTYMSIRDSIRDGVMRGQLFAVLPTLPSSPVARYLYASPEVQRLIVGPWSDEKEEYRCGKLWADFDRFVEGRLISVALDTPYKKPKSTYLSRLDPGRDEVWEIRSRDPRPGIRVFGRFAERDRLIVFNWGYRYDLGGPSSLEFKREILKCKSEWRNLFPSYDPITGTTVNAYIKEKALPV